MRAPLSVTSRNARNQALHALGWIAPYLVQNTEASLRLNTCTPWGRKMPLQGAASISFFQTPQPGNRPAVRAPKKKSEMISRIALSSPSFAAAARSGSVSAPSLQRCLKCALIHLSSIQGTARNETGLDWADAREREKNPPTEINSGRKSSDTGPHFTSKWANVKGLFCGMLQMSRRHYEPSEPTALKNFVRGHVCLFGNPRSTSGAKEAVPLQSANRTSSRRDTASGTQRSREIRGEDGEEFKVGQCEPFPLPDSRLTTARARQEIARCRGQNFRPCASGRTLSLRLRLMADSDSLRRAGGECLVESKGAAS